MLLFLLGTYVDDVAPGATAAGPLALAIPAARNSLLTPGLMVGSGLVLGLGLPLKVSIMVNIGSLLLRIIFGLVLASVMVNMASLLCDSCEGCGRG